MKRTWKDNLTAKMRQQIKEHRRLKLPIMAAMLLVTLLYNTVFYFVHNTKRLASVLVILIFFFVSSSFSFLTEADIMKMAYESEWAEIQESYEYVPTTFHIREEKVLDDDDVLEGYDNEELNVSACCNPCMENIRPDGSRPPLPPASYP